MPIKRSGAIDIAAIRSELGNTGQVSMNDADVRSLINAASGSYTALTEFYGTALITIGTTNTKAGTSYGWASGSYGSITSTNLDSYTLSSVYFIGTGTPSTVNVNITTPNVGSGLITTLTFNGVTANRSGHSTNGSSYTLYQFSFSSLPPTSGTHDLKFHN